MAEKYDLDIPPYPEIAQVVEMPVSGQSCNISGTL